MSKPRRSIERQVYLDRLVDLFVKRIPLNDRVNTVLANAAGDGIDRAALEDDAFDIASARLAAGNRKARPPQADIATTPLFAEDQA